MKQPTVSERPIIGSTTPDEQELLRGHDSVRVTGLYRWYEGGMSAGRIGEDLRENERGRFAVCDCGPACGHPVTFVTMGGDVWVGSRLAPDLDTLFALICPNGEGTRNAYDPGTNISTDDLLRRLADPYCDAL